MSRTASIDIHGFVRSTPGKVVAALLEAGWTQDDQGRITALPLGDEDVSNWQSNPLDDWSEILTRLDKKAQAGEVAGIVLLSVEGGTGGIFLLEPNLRTISFIPSVNRRVMADGFKTTDYSWYLARILPPLERLGYQVDRVACEDIW